MIIVNRRKLRVLCKVCEDYGLEIRDWMRDILGVSLEPT